MDPFTAACVNLHVAAGKYATVSIWAVMSTRYQKGRRVVWMKTI